MKNLKIFAFILLSLISKTSSPQQMNVSFPNAERDSVHNSYFIRNEGWNGGDGAYSLQLPDGRVLWSFGDTFYGTVDSGRIRDGNKNVMVRNSFLIQEKSFSNQFSSLNQGYLKDTKTLIPYKGYEKNEHWYWPLDATIHENQLQMLLMHMVKTGDGMWGFAAVSVDLALFSLPELKLTEIVHDKYSGDISYGSAVFEGDDGYTYLYGSSRTGLVTNLHAARAPDGDLTREWEYWNGTGWQNNQSGFAIHHNVSSMYSIWKESQKYYLFTQE